MLFIHVCIIKLITKLDCICTCMTVSVLLSLNTFFFIIIRYHIYNLRVTGNKLEGDVGDVVSLLAQTSPCFQLREKFKCIGHIGKSETQPKTSP